jgi:hypothetical protein
MRQPGPYWIKYHGREWEIAYWYGDFWIMFGLEDYPKKDDELEEINENRIERLTIEDMFEKDPLNLTYREHPEPPPPPYPSNNKSL